jgi:sec-independent protein translocase protein TatB
MFDIGFWELVMVGVIALLVVGPERLPKLARTAGVYYGKARRFISTVRADVERELKAEELRRVMDEQARSSGVHEIIEESKSALSETKSAVEELDRDMRRQQEAMKEEAEGGKAATQESGAAQADEPEAQKRVEAPAVDEPDAKPAEESPAKRPADESHRSDDG